MKKLMIAAAIVCASALSYGSAISWGGAIANEDGSDTLPAGTTAYLLWSSTAFTTVPTEISAFALGGETTGGAKIVDEYQLNNVDSGSWAFETKYDQNETAGGTAAELNGYYAVIVQNPENGSQGSFLDIGQVAGTTDTTGTINKLYNAGFAEDPGPYLTEGGWTMTAAPEPTSGLLLLIGVAGLALRRRRA